MTSTLLQNLINETIQLSQQSVASGGGPFGALVADSETGAVVATGVNRVVLDSDPSAHGEVVALRAAAKIKGFNLQGYTLFTSTYPCPMCFTAAYWAKVDAVVYANRPEDVAPVFDDATLWQAMHTQPEQVLPCQHVVSSQFDARQVVLDWADGVAQGRIQGYNPS